MKFTVHIWKSQDKDQYNGRILSKGLLNGVFWADWNDPAEMISNMSDHMKIYNLLPHVAWKWGKP